MAKQNRGFNRKTLLEAGVNPLLVSTNYTYKAAVNSINVLPMMKKPHVLSETYNTLTEIDLEMEITKKNKYYTQENTVNYDLVKGNIEMLNEIKDKLNLPENQNKLKQNVDYFQGKVKHFPNMFLNRASIKLININCTFNNLISKALQNGSKFADLCSNPGGFTYTIANKNTKLRLQSYMMSKIGNNYLPVDKKLCNAIYNTNMTYYLTEGDICKDIDRQKFKNTLNDNKMAFVLADGGIDYTGIENFQEYYTKNLYITQCTLAVNILAHDGFFICKMFSTYLKFSCSLLYIMSCMFENIQVIKPESSKSANSECYVVFQKFKYNKNLVQYLNHVICKMENIGDEKEIVNLIKVQITDNTYNKFVQTLININKELCIDQFNAIKLILDDIKINKNKTTTNANKLCHYWITQFKI